MNADKTNPSSLFSIGVDRRSSAALALSVFFSSLLGRSCPAVSSRDANWLAASPLGAGSALIATHWPEILAAQEHAHQTMRSVTPPSLSALGPAEAREIEAIASQIIPTDALSDAREAGVIYFIDRALATFDSDKLVPACCQPTCTIQALAYRAADHIAAEARKAAI